MNNPIKKPEKKDIDWSNDRTAIDAWSSCCDKWEEYVKALEAEIAKLKEVKGFVSLGDIGKKNKALMELLKEADEYFKEVRGMSLAEYKEIKEPKKQCACMEEDCPFEEEGD